MSIYVPEHKSLGRLTSGPGETLTAALRRTLLEMILFGYFDSGNRLFPQKLAEQFDVSPTPVREALMQLSTEGYIEATPRRGYRVKQPNAQLVEELWQVRLGLEVTAAQLAIDRFKCGTLAPRCLDGLRNIQKQRDRLGQRMTPKQHIELNAAFHQALVALSENSILIGIYAAIQLQVTGALVQRGSTAWRNRLEADAAEHHAILAALDARDPVKCAGALHQHIERSRIGALNDIASRQTATTPQEAGHLPRKSKKNRSN